MSSSFVTPQTLLGSSSQTKLLEWVATSFSRGSAQPRDGTCISTLAGGWVLYRWATRAVLTVATPVCIPPVVCVATVVQSLSHVWLCDPIHGLQTRQASLSFIISQSSFRLMSVESVMPSNSLILCYPLLLFSIFPSIGSFPTVYEGSILSISLPSLVISCLFYNSRSNKNELIAQCGFDESHDSD